MTLLIPYVDCSNCFSTTYPRVFGGTSQDTKFNAMDMDSSGNIVVGGQSADSAVLTQSAAKTPFLLYMEQGGNYRWVRQFSCSITSYQNVNAVRLSSTGTYTVFVLDDKDVLQIFTMNNADGYIDKQYQWSSKLVVYQDGLLVDSSDNVYIASQDDAGQTWALFKFSLTSTGSLDFYYQSQTSQKNAKNQMGAVIFDTAKTNIFATGLLKTTYTTLVSLTTSGTLNYQYSSNSGSFNLKFLSVYSTTQIYACSEKVGSNSAFIQFTISSSTSAPTSYRLLVFDQTADCMQIYGADDTYAYAIIRISNEQKLAQLQFTTSGAMRFNMDFNFGGIFSDSSAYVVHGRISSSLVAYWVGYTKKIYTSAAATLYSYAKTVGVIMSSDSTACSGCVGSFTVSYGNNPENAATWTWLTSTSTSSSSFGDYISTATKTITPTTTSYAYQIKSTTLISYTWCNTTTTTTITAPTLTAQTFDIASQTGNSNYQIPTFSIALTGCTYTFFYVASQSSYASLPTGVTFLSSTRTFDFTQATTAGVYTILVVAYLNNGQTSTATFTLTITNYICNSATMSVTYTMTSQTYYVTDSSQTISFSSFSISNTLCTYSYSLNYTDYTQYDTSVFSFSNSSKAIYVYTTSDTKVNTYNLRIYGSLNEASFLRYTYVDVTVVIYSKCYRSTLTTVAISSFTYSVYSNANKTLSTLGWTQLYPSDCPAITYTLSVTSSTCGCTYTGIFSLISDSYITVYTGIDTTYAGTYSLSVSGSNTYFTSTVTFSGVINLVNDCSTTTIATSNIDPQTYTTTNTALDITFTSWTNSLASYCEPFTYTAQFSNGTTIDLSSSTAVVKFDSSQQKFTVSTSDPYEQGTYSITITGTLTTGAQWSQFTFTLTIIDICTTTTITSHTPGNQQYTISSGSTTYSFIDWTESLGFCGPFTYTITYGGASLPIQSSGNNIVTYSSKTFTVDTSDTSLVGTVYTIQITGDCIHNSLSTTFTITIGSCTVTSVSTTQTFPTTEEYTVNDNTLYISVNDFTYSPSYCTSTVSYTLSVDTYSTLPLFIIFVSTSPLSIAITTNSNTNAGTYTIRLTGTIGSTSSSVTIPLKIYQYISNTGPPYFQPDLSDQNVTVGETKYISLSLTDPDGDNCIINYIIYQDISGSFTKQYPGYLTAKPISNSQQGTYLITVMVKDDNPSPLTNQSSFNLTVIPLPIYNVTVVNKSNSTNTTNTTQNNATIIENKTVTFVKTTKDLGAYIFKITSSGKVTVKFSELIKVPSNYTAFNETIFKIIMVPSDYNNDEKVNITSWNVTTMTQSQMILNVNFQYPSKISLYAKDKMKIEFIKNEFFIEKSTGLAIEYEYTTPSKEVPKQLSQDSSTQGLLASSGTIKSVISTLMYGSLGVNLFLAAAMQYLWGMINVLQLIVNMPLFSVNFPANAVLFYSLIVDITNFKLIPTDEIYSKIFSVTDSVAILVLLAVGLTFLLRFLAKRYKLMNILYTFLSGMFFFNMPLRMVLEGYMNYSISTLMNMNSLCWETKSDMASSILAIVMLTGLMIFPFFVWILLWKKIDNLGNDKTKKTFGSLYQELRLTKAAVLYHVFYMLRRIMFVAVAMTLSDYPFFQIQALLLQCIGLIIFDTLVMPYERMILNYIEIFNEICILAAVYHLILFTNYLEGEDLQYNAGWSIIAFTCANILGNMVVMLTFSVLSMIQTIRKIKNKIQRWIAQRRAKKFATTNNDIFDQSIDPTNFKDLGNENDLTKSAQQITNYNLLNNVSQISLDDTIPQKQKSRRKNKNKKDSKKKTKQFNNIQDYSLEMDDPQNQFPQHKNKTKSSRQNITAIFAKKQVEKTDDLDNENKKGLNFYDFYKGLHNNHQDSQQTMEQSFEKSKTLRKKKDGLKNQVPNDIGTIDDDMEVIIRNNHTQNTSPDFKNALNKPRSLSFRIEQAQYAQPLSSKKNDQFIIGGMNQDAHSGDYDAKMAMQHFREQMRKKSEVIQEEPDDHYNFDQSSSLEVQIGGLLRQEQLNNLNKVSNLPNAQHIQRQTTKKLRK